MQFPRIVSTGLILAVFALGGCQTTTLAKGKGELGCAKEDFVSQVSGGKECLAISVIKPQHKSNGIMIVHVHGDISHGINADWAFQKMVSALSRNPKFEAALKIGIVRPGGALKSGLRSTGHDCRVYYRPSGRNVCHLEKNADSIAAAISNLKKHYKPKKTIYVGYSGGGALGGVILGKFNGNGIDTAFLTSGVYDFERWLVSSCQVRPEWGRESVSADSFISGIPNDLKIYVVHGEKDCNIIPDIAASYSKKINKKGGDAELVIVPGAGHSHPDIVNSELFKVRMIKELSTL